MGNMGRVEGKVILMITTIILEGLERAKVLTWVVNPHMAVSLLGGIQPVSAILTLKEGHAEVGAIDMVGVVLLASGRFTAIRVRTGIPGGPLTTIMGHHGIIGLFPLQLGPGEFRADCLLDETTRGPLGLGPGQGRVGGRRRQRMWGRRRGKRRERLRGR